MSQFVLIVDLQVKPECVEAFLVAAREQAEKSVGLEPGCHRFDIIRALDDGSKITHYEIFENAEAFQAHTKMAHTEAFSGKIKDLIVGVDVRQGTLAVAVS